MPAAALDEASVAEYAMLHDGSIWLGFFHGAGVLQRASQALHLTQVGASVAVGMNGAGKVVGLTFPNAVATLEGVPPNMERPDRPGVAFGLGRWGFGHEFDRATNTVRIDLGEWQPAQGEQVHLSTVNVFGHDVEFYQAMDGRLFRVDIPDARNAVPSRVWRADEDFETRRDDDGSLHLGMFPGSFPLFVHHESVRYEEPSLDVDVYVDRNRQVIGFRFLSPKSRLADGDQL